MSPADGSAANRDVEVEGEVHPLDPGSDLGFPADEERRDVAPAPRARRRPKPWAIIGGVILVLACTVVGVSYTSLFAAKHVRVEGIHHLGAARVLAIGGIGLGTNLLHTDLGEAQARLERSPWVAQATVGRHLPGDLTVSIVERAPVAAVLEGTGAPVMIAADGTRLGTKPRGEPLPIVQGTDASAGVEGSVVATGGAVAASMTPLLRDQVAEVIVGPDGSILARTRAGVMVAYGDATELVAKSQALQAVLSQGSGAGVAYVSVDVSVPSAPTARRETSDGSVSIPPH